MHATADIKTLSKAITAIKPAAAPRGSGLPILTHIRLDAIPGAGLRVSATDLDRSATTVVPADVHAAGGALASVKELAAAVKGKGVVEFRAEGDELVVVNGLTSRLRSGQLEDWPKPVEGPWGDPIRLQTSVLRSVLPAACTDNARPILTGVLFQYRDGAPWIAATDSYRLHTVELAKPCAEAWGQVEGDDAALVPAAALKAAIGKATEVTVQFGSDTNARRFARVEAGDVVWTIRLIEGEFPNYRQLLPRETSMPTAVTVARPAFDDNLKALASFARAHNAPVRIEAGSPVRLTVRVQDHGEKVAEVPGHSDLAIAFTPDYLAGLFDGMASCTLMTVDALKPALLSETDDDGNVHRRLVMPVRVS